MLEKPFKGKMHYYTLLRIIQYSSGQTNDAAVGIKFVYQFGMVDKSCRWKMVILASFHWDLRL